MEDLNTEHPIQIRVKRLNPAASMPMKMTAHAAGFDLSASLPAGVTLQPGEIRLIPCGFAMAIPVGYEAQVRPRSGLSTKFGITMINGIGTIDSDYRGEVQVPLVNHGKSAFTIEPGMRIAQMLILPVPPATIFEVEELDETVRGTGGFGHTGH